MYVRDALRGHAAVSIGIRRLTGNISIGRVPDHLQVWMRHRLEQARGLRAGGDVASVLILQADDAPVELSLPPQVLQRARDAFEASLRPHRAPIGKHANNARAGTLRDGEGAVCQTWLIV